MTRNWGRRHTAHPDAITTYLTALRAEYPQLSAEDFRWNLDVLAANRQAYWRVSHEIDRCSLRSGLSDVATPLRRLRRVPPAEPADRDIADIYQEGIWPKGHYIVFTNYRRAP